jgi:hypothetical protein
MNYIGDVIRIESYDGLTLEFPDPTIRLLSYEGLGAPPIQFITRRGYKMNGQVLIDTLLNSRSLDIQFWHSPACDRQDYWDVRAELHNIFRPNRGGPLTLTLFEPGGNQRAIQAWVDPGFSFPMDDNNWSVNETLSLTAFDPIWYDPDATSTDYDMTGQVNTDLVFPITFPIIFGTSGLIFSTGSITYPGTWKTYPVFTLTGPYTSATISNLQTNAVLTMVVPISAGETRIIDLTPGSQRIEDANGVSRFNELGEDSNLVELNIRPDPEVAGGIQTIRVIMLNGTMGQSGAHIQYFNRYYAI